MWKKDTMKSNAYKEISKREGIESEQLGVIAEKMMCGVAEMISIDRADLHVEVLPANAYQDVEEKIDFILNTKTKNRGVGINKDETVIDEKSFGIQFTINTKKADFKNEQIQKAKERGIDVDDILYVSIDYNMLRNAMIEWKKKGEPISGPWNFLPRETQKNALKNLFHSIITPEQEESLLKNYN